MRSPGIASALKLLGSAPEETGEPIGIRWDFELHASAASKEARYLFVHTRKPHFLSECMRPHEIALSSETLGQTARDCLRDHACLLGREREGKTATPRVGRQNFWRWRNPELECEELGRGILAAQMRAHRTAFGCIDIIFALMRRSDM